MHSSKKIHIEKHKSKITRASRVVTWSGEQQGIIPKANRNKNFPKPKGVINSPKIQTRNFN